MSAIGNSVINEARKHIGKPYVLGTAGPNTFDCSGYVSFCLTKVTGTWWSRSSYDYPSLGQSVEKQAVDSSGIIVWQPGDVLCFDTEGNGRAGHVGFFAGMVDGQPVMFNAINPEGGVRRDNPLSTYFKPRLIAVRRVVFDKVDPVKPDPKPGEITLASLNSTDQKIWATIEELENRVTALERRQAKSDKAKNQPRLTSGQFATNAQLATNAT